MIYFICIFHTFLLYLKYTTTCFFNISIWVCLGHTFPRTDSINVNLPHESAYSGDYLSHLRKVKNGLTSCGLSGLLSITNWIMPRMFPSMDMDLLSVSMASWLDLPRRDSPFTATSWSFTRSRPSWGRGENSVRRESIVMTGSWWEEKFKHEEERVRMEAVLELVEQSQILTTVICVKGVIFRSLRAERIVELNKYQ